MQVETLATLIWIPCFVVMGYLFSYTAVSVSRNAWKFSLVVLLLVILYFIVDKFISWLYEFAEEFHNHDKPIGK